MYNVKQLLEGGTFVTPEVARGSSGIGEKPSKIVLKRTDREGAACQYNVVDNPAMLQQLDWLKG
jgi:hypothetical protein